jgi:hypothetical protein
MALPLLGERRFVALTVAGMVGVVSLFMAPRPLWASYLAQLDQISDRLLDDLHRSGTLYRAPWLVPLGLPGLAALLVVDIRAACWLAIPALWPGMEYYYGSSRCGRPGRCRR